MHAPYCWYCAAMPLRAFFSITHPIFAPFLIQSKKKHRNKWPENQNPAICQNSTEQKKKTRQDISLASAIPFYSSACKTFFSFLISGFGYTSNTTQVDCTTISLLVWLLACTAIDVSEPFVSLACICIFINLQKKKKKIIGKSKKAKQNCFCSYCSVLNSRVFLCDCWCWIIHNIAFNRVFAYAYKVCARDTQFYFWVIPEPSVFWAKEVVITERERDR